MPILLVLGRLVRVRPLVLFSQFDQSVKGCLSACRGSKIEARAQTGLPHVGCKCAFALFVFKLDERGWHSVATGNVGDGAVWGSVWEHPGVYGSSMGECMGATTWEDQARSQHAGIVHLTRHPQNDKIWQPVMAGTFPIIDQNVTFPLSGPS